MSYPLVPISSRPRRSIAWLRWLCLAAAVNVVPTIAHADFITPANWTRGAAYTTYHEWDFFNSPAGPNAPDVPGKFPTGQTWTSPSPGSPTPNAFDTSGNSFVTGGGNIYSFSGITNIKVDVPDYKLGADYLTTVLLQVRTLGTEPVLTGEFAPRLTITGSSDKIYAYDSGELARVSLGGSFGGDQVDRAFVFHVPDNGGSYRIEFDSAGSSMSLDRVSVDAIVTRESIASLAQSGMHPTIGYVPQPVPEPTGLALAAIAGGGLLMRRRRS